MSDAVGDFIEQDKALCWQALVHGSDVLLRAVEMIDRANRQAASADDDVCICKTPTYTHSGYDHTCPVHGPTQRPVIGTQQEMT